ncbi:hypothetical protein HDU87_002075 [Geranomyces variabilis]|uniref:Methyltransferase domain-containing protein n=1 Tax=Geranomyces variabilis TaxID=109894 RepID=A0AAD5XLN4_9FUNG|nr:hypothetical protein HDU87_002075 [Geranomyces variabilis]
MDFGVQPGVSWAPLDLLPATFQCDANHLQHFGPNGEGGKWLCTDLIDAHGEDCHIFSLGSRGEFDFEESMAAYTKGKCKIYSFDCTGEWHNPATTFYPWCLGAKDEVIDGRQYKRLSTVAKELKIPHISLLKMDIEGYEFGVFESLLTEPTGFLPKQISFELHVGTPFSSLLPAGGDMLDVVSDLSDTFDKLGYKVAMQERNVLCTWCSEYIIVRDP